MGFRSVVLGFLFFLSLNLSADVKFGGLSIRESSGNDVVNLGTYLIPNEGRHDLFAPFIRRSGDIFAGVGTVRVFNESAYGNYSYVFILDYDQASIAYDKLIIELLKISDNRKIFMSYLMRGMISNDFINSLSGIRDGFEDSVVDFTPVPDKELIRRWKDNLADFAGKAEILDLLSVMKTRVMGGKGTMLRATSMSSRMFQVFVQCSTFGETIFGSDAMFKKAKWYAVNNRYLPVLVNVGSTDAMYSLSLAINSSRLLPGVLDFSNVLENLNSQELYVVKAFIDNTEFSDNASILFTSLEPVEGLDFLGNDVKFYYYAVSPEELSSRVIGYYISKK